MKNLFYLLIFVVVGCSNPPHQEAIVNKYYEAINTGDFNLISEYFSDSLLFLEMEHTVSDSKEKYQTIFDWDTHFSPKIEILETTFTDNNTIEVLVTKTCVRIDYLNNKPLKSKQLFVFEDQKIKTINTVGFVDEDFEIWSNSLAELNSYIDSLHPELSGFAYNLTKAGAVDYLKAIELFENKQ